MPTYQYRCTKCDEAFERYQSFTDDPIAKCPLPADRPKGWDGTDAARGQKKCRGEVRKVFGSVGVAFKGSGFYRNDSRAAANGRAETNGRADSKSDGADRKSSDASADSGSSGGASSGTADGRASGDGTSGGSDKKGDAKKPAKAASATS